MLIGVAYIMSVSFAPLLTYQYFDDRMIWEESMKMEWEVNAFLLNWQKVHPWWAWIQTARCLGTQIHQWQPRPFHRQAIYLEIIMMKTTMMKKDTFHHPKVRKIVVPISKKNNIIKNQIFKVYLTSLSIFMTNFRRRRWWWWVHWWRWRRWWRRLLRWGLRRRRWRRQWRSSWHWKWWWNHKKHKFGKRASGNSRRTRNS